MTSAVAWLSTRRTALEVTAWLLVVAAIAAEAIDTVRRSTGVDVAPVWLAIRAFLRGGSPYASYGAQSPFPYPPSSLVLLAPVGGLGFTGARVALWIAGLAAIVGGGLCLYALTKRPWRAPLLPLWILFLVVAQPTYISLFQGNINPVVFAAEGAFLLAAGRGRWLLAGPALGVALAIKPVMVALLLVLVLYRKWPALALALAVPAGLSAAAWVANPASADFLSVTIPALTSGEQVPGVVNASLRGAAAILGVPGALTAVAWLAVLAASAWLLARCWTRSSEPVTRLCRLSGVLVLATLLLSSFSEDMHAIFLLPLVVAALVVGGRMPVLAWVGLTLAISPTFFAFTRIGRSLNLGVSLATLTVTLGELLVLGGLTAMFLQSRAKPATLDGITAQRLD